MQLYAFVRDDVRVRVHTLCRVDFGNAISAVRSVSIGHCRCGRGNRRIYYNIPVSGGDVPVRCQIARPVRIPVQRQ